MRAIKQGYDECAVKAIAAGEIEAKVIEHLKTVFASPSVIAQTYRDAARQAGNATPALDEQQVPKALSYLHPVWDNLFPREQERIMRLLLDKMILQENEIDIRLTAFSFSHELTLT